MTEDEIRKHAFAMPLANPASRRGVADSSTANTASSPAGPIRIGGVEALSAPRRANKRKAA
jgi:acetoacetate decarboxylase